MRDFRDAKLMAHGLREALSAKEMKIGHGEALEIVSQMFGLADWNTLSARIDKARGKPDRGGSEENERRTLPALPIKDMAPFPTMQLPLWIKRPQTIEALSRALSSGRDVALVAQRDRHIEDPGADDVHEIGVLARVLDVGRPSDEAIARAPMLEGSTQVLLQTQGRVIIRSFTGQAGQFEAEIEPINEGPIQSAPELIEQAVTAFEAYAAARNIDSPPMWPPLRQLNDPGRVAEVIARRMRLSAEEAQAVLAMLDPIARLELVIAKLAE